MADVISRAEWTSSSASRAGVDETAPAFELIELLFFAYRDFIADADHVLAPLGFGRAHHRVLHFVHRRPGITVAALLVILQITKQSLGRVLKQLIDDGFIEQKAGADDRRQRLLFATQRGRALAMHLARMQSARLHRALGALGPGAHERVRCFLAAMIDEGGRADIMTMIGASDPPPRRSGKTHP